MFLFIKILFFPEVEIYFCKFVFFLLFFVVVGNYVVDFEKSVASISTKSVYGKWKTV